MISTSVGELYYKRRGILKERKKSKFRGERNSISVSIFFDFDDVMLIG